MSSSSTPHILVSEREKGFQSESRQSGGIRLKFNRCWIGKRRDEGTTGTLKQSTSWLQQRRPRLFPIRGFGAAPMGAKMRKTQFPPSSSATTSGPTTGPSTNPSSDPPGDPSMDPSTNPSDTPPRNEPFRGFMGDLSRTFRNRDELLAHYHTELIGALGRLGMPLHERVMALDLDSNTPETRRCRRELKARCVGVLGRYLERLGVPRNDKYAIVEAINALDSEYSEAPEASRSPHPSRSRSPPAPQAGVSGVIDLTLSEGEEVDDDGPSAPAPGSRRRIRSPETRPPPAAAPAHPAVAPSGQRCESERGPGREVRAISGSGRGIIAKPGGGGSSVTSSLGPPPDVAAGCQRPPQPVAAVGGSPIAGKKRLRHAGAISVGTGGRADGPGAIARATAGAAAAEQGQPELEDEIGEPSPKPFMPLAFVPLKPCGDGGDGSAVGAGTGGTAVEKSSQTVRRSSWLQ